MFKKKIEYVHDNNGKIIGVNVGNTPYRIEQYNLMLNHPCFYVYDGLGNKITNANSFQDIDWFIRNNIC